MTRTSRTRRTRGGGEPRPVATAPLTEGSRNGGRHDEPAHHPDAPARPGAGGEWLAVRADRLFVPLAFLVLAIAAALRLPELALNPFHHDEGINGFFTTNLVRNGVYAYDPANYHGPTLYYFALVSEILFGLTTEAMRLVPVFFGLVTVAAVLALRPILGAVAVLAAALLLAISPGAVYMSRYFIHEALLVCFSVTLVVAALLYLRSRRPAFLLAAAASAALIFATKETGIITVVVLAIAAGASGVYVELRHGKAVSRRESPSKPRRKTAPAPRTVWIDGVEYRAVEPPPHAAPSSPKSWLPPGEQLVSAAVVFVTIYVLFFTSFFDNFPKGLADSLATFTIWTQTGGETQVQPFHQYLVWMAGADAPILVLGTVGGLIAAIRARERIWVFLGLWALGVTLAYSLVAYKTPWIVLNMLVPLALLAGLAVRDGLAIPRWRPAAAVVLVAAVGMSAYQAVELNFRHYDDDAYPYVFVHTTREALDLVEEIETIAARAGTGEQTGIVFVTSDYWPLPWYLRDYPRAGFFGQIVDTEEAMVVANVTQQAEIAPRLEGRYRSAGIFNLRPGVDLELYVRSDLAAP